MKLSARHAKAIVCSRCHENYMRVVEERDEDRKNYQFMVDRAADEKLDGYRELAALAAAAENERDDLRRVVDEFRTVDIPAHVAEIDRLRGALEASTVVPDDADGTASIDACVPDSVVATLRGLRARLATAERQRGELMEMLAATEVALGTARRAMQGDVFDYGTTSAAFKAGQAARALLARIEREVAGG
jgi:hypothetical protein